MKTKALIIFCLLSFSTILYSQDSDNKIIEKTGEYISYGINNIQKRLKVVYKFNSEGQKTERISYARDNTFNWTPVQKYDFKYNQQGKIADVIYTKWNKVNNSWSGVSEHLIHIYNKKGELLSVKKSRTDSDINLAYN
ncbi:hypothetical protein [Dysgonomonas sp. Marseille-P4361]|uniref:hypothetical protein n=1 Tax=Dysgonomonas sp. Marseille-P4361 TaxID=2161820 RepID=UPI001358DA8A|nr:hypothetical protein [Dysgonomonas sp. Marseille-P4361]